MWRKITNGHLKSQSSRWKTKYRIYILYYIIAKKVVICQHRLYCTVQSGLVKQQGSKPNKWTWKLPKLPGNLCENKSDCIVGREKVSFKGTVTPGQNALYLHIVETKKGNNCQGLIQQLNCSTGPEGISEVFQPQNGGKIPLHFVIFPIEPFHDMYYKARE